MVNGWRILRERWQGEVSYQEARLALGLLLVVVIISLIGWLYLTQASQVTATGYRIHELELEKAKIERANALLRLQIAQLESIPRIEARARELGFAPPQKVRYLVVPVEPVEHAPPQAFSPQQSTAHDDSLWEMVLSQLSAWLTSGR